jgi:hypothetical protein
MIPHMRDCASIKVSASLTVKRFEVANFAKPENVNNLIQEQLKIIFSLMRYWCIFTPIYKHYEKTKHFLY